MLHDIQLLLRFCQFIGAFPYRIYTDETSDRKIIKFSFSWRCLAFVWFSLITLLNVSALVIAGDAIFSSFGEQSLNTNATFILCSFSSQFLFLLSSRLIVLQPKKWNRVLRLLLVVDQSQKRIQSKAIRLEIILIILWIAISELVVLIAAFPIINGNVAISAIPITTLKAILNYILYLNIQIPIWFVYFSYRILGHYLKTASLLFTDEKGVTRDKNRYEKCISLTNDLSAAVEILNTILSFPVFVMLCAAFANAVLDLYLFITTFIKEEVFFSNAQATVGAIFLLNVIIILLILYAGEIPKQQVHHVRECIMRNQSYRELSFEFFKPYMRKDSLTDEKLEVSAILLQLKDERFRLSVLGLFDAGLHHIPALTGTVVTYLVVIFQQVGN